jgi:hypothetical protein
MSGVFKPDQLLIWGFQHGPETLVTVTLSIIIADLCLAVWSGVAQTIRVPQFLDPRALS